MFRSFFFMVVALALVSFFGSSYLANHVSHARQEAARQEAPRHEPVRQDNQTPQTANLVAPRTASVSGSDEIEIPADPHGGYKTNAEIDGYVLRMIVDTGATYVCLTDADASAIGVRPAPADYTYRTQTANGVGVAARIKIDRLRLGQVEIHDVDAFVMPRGALSISLLGMSALNRLGKVEIAAGKLVLRQ